jgi:hypothetical protein
MYATFFPDRFNPSCHVPLPHYDLARWGDVLNVLDPLRRRARQANDPAVFVRPRNEYELQALFDGTLST